MAVKKYRVKLTEEERDSLKQLISKGKALARKRTHAHILLHADEDASVDSLKDAEIV